jgi:hypothetical protein
MGYLKHNSNGNSNGAKRSKKKAAEQSSKPETVQPVHVNVDMSGVEVELAALANSVKSYVVNSYDGENKLKIFTGPEGSGYHPVLIALDPCGEATKDMLAIGERIAVAFERIADAMTGKAST